MKFSEIKHKIKNLGNFKSLKEIKEAGLRIVRNTKTGDYWLIEEEFLRPFLFSLKEVRNYQIELPLLKKKLFFCQKKITEEKAEEYIKWGERLNFNKRPSTSGRSLWYGLTLQKPPDFVSNRFLGERIGFPLNSNAFVCDVFFVGWFKKEIDKEIAGALINSTISYLSIELIARKTYGIGVAYIYGPEIENLLLLNLQILDPSKGKRLREIFSRMKKRPIYSIFTELGFDPSKPIREQEPNPLPDRKALDDIVFDALGLTKEERKEVYWAVAELVKNRLEKAKSV